MRILFMFTHINRSGAPKMMAWVANQMAQAGHEVHLLSYFSDKCEQELDPGVQFSSLNICRSGSRLVRNTLGMARTVGALDAFVRRVKPDVTVTFLDSVGYVYLLLNRIMKRCRMVASERADPYTYKGVMGKIRTFLLRSADAVVFQTEGARDFYGGIRRIAQRSEVIPNPVLFPPQVQQMLPSLRVTSAQRDRRIVSVGRLSMKQKRPDVLLRAFRIVHEKCPETTLHFYGKGEAQEQILQLAQELGVADSVVLQGESTQVLQEIHNAGVFAMSSDFEGIPNALIEALSVGVPCVSTDCRPGGARLLIRDGENGFITPRGDAEAMAQRLLQVLGDPALADGFSQRAVSVCDEFSGDVIARKWAAVLEGTAR